MKKWLLGLVSAVLGLTPLLTHAQVTTAPDGIPLTAQELMEQLSPAQLISATGQTATPQNQVILQQVGAGNTATVNQLGLTNAVLATQNGNGLNTTIEQNGNGNTVTSEISGTGTSSAVVQTGNQNLLQQQLNVDNRRYSVEQQGSFNQLIQREGGINAPPGYEVKMVGNGIRMTVEQGVGTVRP